MGKFLGSYHQFQLSGRALILCFPLPYHCFLLHAIFVNVAHCVQTCQLMQLP